VGVKALEIEGYKWWYLGRSIARNGVGIVIKKELADQVVEVMCKGDRIMLVKLVGCKYPQCDICLCTTNRVGG